MSESKQITPMQSVYNAMVSSQMQSHLKQVLPPSITVDRFTRTALTAIQMKPELVEADHKSLYNSVLLAAQDGLLPNGRQGAIVVYNTNSAPPGAPKRYVKKCQWMVMVEGCIHKLTKAGVMAYAVSVYKGDLYRFWNDEDGQHAKHEMDPFAPRGDRVGAFAVGKVLATGSLFVEPMNMEELTRARNASKTPDKGPWVEWPERMEQKCCLHRIDKRIGTAALTEDDAEGVPDRETELPTEVRQPIEVVSAQGEESRERHFSRPRALQSVVDQMPEEKLQMPSESVPVETKTTETPPREVF